MSLRSARHWISTHWPLLTAGSFLVLLLVVVTKLYSTQIQLRRAVDVHFLADSAQRAGELSDFLRQKELTAKRLASSSSIEAYLVNVALGMSLQYGLNANLDYIEAELSKELRENILRGQQVYRQIAFLDDRGTTLVRTGSADIELPDGLAAESPEVIVDSQHRTLIATAPVVHKGTRRGTLVTVTDLDVLGKLLISTGTGEGAAGYREYLLVENGRQFVSAGATGKLSPSDALRLGQLPNGIVTTTASLHDLALGAGEIALRTPVSPYPLSILTLTSEEQAYGQIGSPLFLLCIGAVSIALFSAAMGFERMRLRAHQLDATLVKLAAERDAAQEANRTKSAFLAMMSHEIRTPMNAVLGLTTSLLDDKITEEQRSALTTIHEASDSLLGILDDILDYSKLEAGAFPLEAIAFSPDEIARSAVSILSARAEAKGLAITSIYDANLPAGLLGDAARLRQVILNLISNAVKFTAVGGIRLECRCIERNQTRATVEWSVADTGIGIAPEQIGELFRDYVQADMSINRRFGGTGLGLSICKRILDRMGGTIQATSVLNQGTTVRFRVDLPIASIVPDSSPDAAPQIAIGEHAAKLGRAIRILVADDNSTNRLVAAKMLQDPNVQIYMAADGAEAVAMTLKTHFDVILMDVRMPEMDGLAASRAIRKRGLDVPIIAFTANAFDDDRVTCREAGMGGFVSKPVRKPQLLSAISQALNEGAQQARGTKVACHPAQSEDAGEVAQPLILSDEYDTLADALGEDGMREALTVFVEETAARLSALRSFRLADQRDAIRREAHSVKGAASNFGFRRLSESAKWLEQNSGRVDAASLAGAVSRMQTELAQTRSAIAI